MHTKYYSCCVRKHSSPWFARNYWSKLEARIKNEPLYFIQSSFVVWSQQSHLHKPLSLSPVSCIIWFRGLNLSLKKKTFEFVQFWFFIRIFWFRELTLGLWQFLFLKTSFFAGNKVIFVKISTSVPMSIIKF